MGDANFNIPKNFQGFWLGSCWDFTHWNWSKPTKKIFLYLPPRISLSTDLRFNSTYPSIWALATASSINLSFDCLIVHRSKICGLLRSIGKALATSLCKFHGLNLTTIGCSVHYDRFNLVWWEFCINPTETDRLEPYLFLWKLKSYKCTPIEVLNKHV